LLQETRNILLSYGIAYFDNLKHRVVTSTTDGQTLEIETLGISIAHHDSVGC